MIKTVNTNGCEEWEAELVASQSGAELWLIPPSPNEDKQMSMKFHDLKDAERFFNFCALAIYQLRNPTPQFPEDPALQR